MPNIDYAGPLEESSFRRMAMGTWGHPWDPSIYGWLDMDVTAATERLEALRGEGARVTWTHVAARAVAVVLARLPDMNVMPRLGRVWQRRDVDVFLQVALPRSEDDLVGTDLSGVKVRKADSLDLAALAADMEARVAQVRARQDPELEASKQRIDRIPPLLMRPVLRLVRWLQYALNLDLRWAGMPRDPFGSALVTSMGMMGVETAFAPLFPIGGPPLVLLVGNVKQRPVVALDGSIVARPMLRLCGTFDHRVYDGFQIARFAKELRKVIEVEVDAL